MVIFALCLFAFVLLLAAAFFYYVQNQADTRLIHHAHGGEPYHAALARPNRKSLVKKAVGYEDTLTKVNTARLGRLRSENKIAEVYDERESMALKREMRERLHELSMTKAEVQKQLLHLLADRLTLENHLQIAQRLQHTLPRPRASSVAQPGVAKQPNPETAQSSDTDNPNIKSFRDQAQLFEEFYTWFQDVTNRYGEEIGAELKSDMHRWLAQQQFGEDF